jgi:hypothetical protein
MAKKTSDPKNEVVAAARRELAKAENRAKEAKANLARIEKEAKGGK